MYDISDAFSFGADCSALVSDSVIASPVAPSVTSPAIASSVVPPVDSPVVGPAVSPVPSVLPVSGVSAFVDASSEASPVPVVVSAF